jgi:hypothetical protein
LNIRLWLFIEVNGKINVLYLKLPLLGKNLIIIILLYAKNPKAYLHIWLYLIDVTMGN